jgi:hypothetical protein
MEFNREDIKFLLDRASHAGSISFKGDRDTGASSNSIVAIAYDDNKNIKDLVLPSDESDLQACENMYKKLPIHRKNQITEHIMKLAREAIYNKRPYFHELTPEQIETLLKGKCTWGNLAKNYRQPEWCNYPDALEGIMGCWSLIDMTKDGYRTKISREYCKDCPEFKKEK